MARRLLSVLLLACLAAAASVVRVELVERTDVLDGKPMGPAGPYERIVAKVHFAVDPELPANRIISDIDLAPLNDQGRVEFSADLYVLKPRDPGNGNGTILFEVPNRGGKGLLNRFSDAASSLDTGAEAELGDGFLLEQGFTVVWLGWQFDVPRSPVLLRLCAPVARDGDRPITGLLRSEFVPNEKVLSFSLADRTMIAYPVADPDDLSLQLTVRDRVEGTRQVIPRKQWQFAREQNGRPVPDRTSVFMSGGFEPGRIYEIVYPAQDPVLVGLGPAGVRDLISFLKYGTQDGDIMLLGDQRRRLKRAIAFGSSQSGRFLRTFLSCGFNRDEEKRRVFDAVWAHVAGGGRGSFNHRFAQASRDGGPFMNLFYPTDIFPFTDLPETDPETNLTDGILVRALEDGVAPKVFYTNGSYEYWGRAASLTHTTLDGRKDVAPAKNTRIYFFTGSQHGPAGFPPRRGETRNLANPNDFRWSMRALLVALDRWITDGSEPPASQYPRIAENELVPLEEVRFPKIPGVEFPTRMHKAYRVDYGPQFRSKGIVTIEPPRVGKAFGMLVPQVDGDGNEKSGIRMPEIQVPLATYTGWNLRDPRIGAPEELYSMAGSYIPFARTAAEREKNGDPRLSIEERYRSRQDYLDKVSAAAHELVRGRYLLERDVKRLVEHAGEHWDHLVGAP